MERLSEMDERELFIREIAWALRAAAELQHSELDDPCWGEEHCIYYSRIFSCPECRLAKAVFDRYMREGRNVRSLTEDFYISQVASALGIIEGRIKSEAQQRPCRDGECLFRSRDFTCEECALIDAVRVAFQSL